MYCTYEGGRLILAYVGAFIVGSVVLHDKKRFKKGEEMGYFEFGSSIVMIIETD